MKSVKRVTRLKGVTVNSVEALTTAFTQQLVSVVIEADSVFLKLYSFGDVQSSGAAVLMARTAAQITGRKRHSRILVVYGADADGSRGGTRPAR